MVRSNVHSIDGVTFTSAVGARRARLALQSPKAAPRGTILVCGRCIGFNMLFDSSYEPCVRSLDDRAGLHVCILVIGMPFCCIADIIQKTVYVAAALQLCSWIRGGVCSQLKKRLYGCSAVKSCLCACTRLIISVLSLKDRSKLQCQACTYVCGHPSDNALHFNLKFN